MKKILGFAALVLASLISITSCSKKSSNNFVLGLDDSFPPLGFRDENNQIVGYDIDLAQEVANRLGKTLVCQPIDWAAKEQELNTGKIDCIWSGFTMSEERVNAMAFTKPYLDNAQVAVVRKDSGFKTMADLKDLVIGVQAESSAVDAINDNLEFKNSVKKIIEFKENITALNDLGIGQVDAVIMDSVVANYSISQTGKDFVVLDEILAHEEYGIAFKKDNTELRDKVQNALNEMEADGTVAKISEKWFGTNLSVIGK